MNSFSSGQLIGRYRILELLGAGAMGEVYLAEDPQIERKLAIKTVRLAGRPQEVEDRKLRLSREAKAAGRLLHPSIVTLFDAGEAEGTFFLAFELVEGEDLSELLNRSLTEPSLRPTVGQCLSYVRQTAEGLDCAHRQGIVHRDVKPSNLLLTRDGVIKISDFGIAKVAGQATELTTTGTVVGSPFYLSPEQIRGEELDGRSDLFSLGSVLYELLTRRRPFDGETISTLVYQILHTEPKPAWEVSAQLAPAIQRLLQRLLAKDRDHRYATAADAAKAIAEIAAALPPEVLDAPPPESVPGDQTVVLSTSGAFEGQTTGQAAAAAGSRPLAVPPTMTGPSEVGIGAEPGTSGLSVTPSSVIPSAQTGTQGMASPTPPLPPLPAPPMAQTGSPGAALPAVPSQPAQETATSGQAIGGHPAVPVAAASRGGRIALVLGIMTLAIVAGVVFLYFVVQHFFEPPPKPAAGTSAESALESGELPENASNLESIGAGIGGDTVAPTGRAGVDQGSGALGSADEATGSGEALPSTRPNLASAAGDDSGRAGTQAGEKEATPSSAAEILAQRREDRVERRQAVVGDGDAVSGQDSAAGDRPPVRDGVVDARRNAPKTRPGTSVPVEPEPVTERLQESIPASRRAPPHQRVESGLRIGLSVTPPDAFVLLDGTLLGRATRFDPRRKGGEALELPGPGTYELKFRSQGMEDYRVEVQAANVLSATPLSIRLRQASGSDLEIGDLEVVRVKEAIAFEEAPDDAEVWVDGRRIGRVGDYPGRATRGRTWLELPVGRHRISVRKNGYRQKDFAVEVSNGAEERRQRLVVQLTRERGS